jgi:hypothetical protein
MSTIAYLQCPTGIAGDMFLGALVSAGVPLEYLVEQLALLNVSDEYELREEKVIKNGQSAIKVHVDLKHHHHNHHRHLGDIEQLINQSNLPPKVADNSLAIFRTLANAEAKVHGTTIDKVHFHEVGATDAIIDIVGTCLGLDYLGIEELYCSSLPTGGGYVKAAHGKLPVPVPAVLELWQIRQVPVYSNGIDRELVTPTGAAIVTTLVKDFGDAPSMKLKRIGLGAGTIDLAIPNILRLWLGEVESKSNCEKVAVLETQIDDCSPQIFGYLLEELFKIGVRDVFTQPVMMKKNRPGILLTVICDLDQVDLCEEIIFRETTTIGIRRQIQERSILERKIETVNTEYGDIRIKIAYQQGKIINIQPEYEDCACLAREFNLPFQTIFFTAQNSYHHNMIY